MGHQTEARFLRPGKGILYGRFVQQPVLDQALLEPAQCHAAGSAYLCYCVIIQGLTLIHEPLLPAYYW